MKRAWGITLLAAAGVGVFLLPQGVRAQACKDDVAMLEASKQDLVELTATVKKQNLAEFEQTNQQKRAVNKLRVHTGMLQELVNCLDKAAQDTAASKADADAAKAQHDAAAKLLEKLQHQANEIRDAKESKAAKALIEKLEFTSPE